MMSGNLSLIEKELHNLGAMRDFTLLSFLYFIVIRNLSLSRAAATHVHQQISRQRGETETRPSDG